MRPRASFPWWSRNWARASATRPALIGPQETFSHAGLAARANRYARWALAQGIEKGDTVCLLMPNRPDYLAIWLGITRIGGVVALINTNLTGEALAHCITVAAAQAHHRRCRAGRGAGRH